MAAGGKPIAKLAKTISDEMLEVVDKAMRKHAKKAAKRETKATKAAERKAMREPHGKYEASPKHPKGKGFWKGGKWIAPRPKRGQHSLNHSAPLGPNTTRRVGVDKKNGQYSVFDEHREGLFHGHQRNWSGDSAKRLGPSEKRALIVAELVNKQGKIL